MLPEHCKRNDINSSRCARERRSNARPPSLHACTHPASGLMNSPCNYCRSRRRRAARSAGRAQLACGMQPQPQQRSCRRSEAVVRSRVRAHRCAGVRVGRAGRQWEGGVYGAKAAFPWAWAPGMPARDAVLSSHGSDWSRQGVWGRWECMPGDAGDSIVGRSFWGSVLSAILLHYHDCVCVCVCSGLEPLWYVHRAPLPCVQTAAARSVSWHLRGTSEIVFFRDYKLVRASRH